MVVSDICELAVAPGARRFRAPGATPGSYRELMRGVPAGSESVFEALQLGRQFGGQRVPEPGVPLIDAVDFLGPFLGSTVQRGAAGVRR